MLRESRGWCELQEEEQAHRQHGAEHHRVTAPEARPQTVRPVADYRVRERVHDQADEDGQTDQPPVQTHHALVEKQHEQLEHHEHQVADRPGESVQSLDVEWCPFVHAACRVSALIAPRYYKAPFYSKEHTWLQ